MVRWLWDERAAEAALGFLRDTKVGCAVAPRKPPGGECDGEGSEGEGNDNDNEEGGLGLP